MARHGSGAALRPADRKLVAAALAAREHAHAPWSLFKVGAAARFGKRIVAGCNIEFDVYGLTNCAERTAIFAAFAAGLARQPLTAIAVIADTPEPVCPCGACRQVMLECGGVELRVILANLRGDVRIVQMRDLLPGAFRLDPRMQGKSPSRRSASRKASR
jgi:cytidine deaminase